MDDEDSYTEGREDRRRRPEKGGLTVLAPPGPGCKGSERQAGEDLATNFLDDIVGGSHSTRIPRFFPRELWHHWK
jgi:hypothetical protein